MVPRHRRLDISFDNGQQLAPAPQGVRLPFDKLAPCRSRLCLQFDWLITDPAEFGNGVGTCDVQARRGGGDKGDRAEWRVHGDLLPHVACYPPDCLAGAVQHD